MRRFIVLSSRGLQAIIDLFAAGWITILSPPAGRARGRRRRIRYCGHAVADEAVLRHVEDQTGLGDAGLASGRILAATSEGVRQRFGVLARHGLRPHGGARRAGIDAVDAQREVLRLVGPGAAQRLDRRLGGRIGRPEGAGVMRCAATTSGWRGRHRTARSSGSTERISRQVAVTLTVITFSKTLASIWPIGEITPRIAGIGHQHVELAPALVDGAAQPVDAGHVGQVERHQRGAAAARP